MDDVALELRPADTVAGSDDHRPGTSAHDSMQHERRALRIGCALLPKKVSRYLTPAMKAIALSHGMELCLIDYSRPLEDQGPFDAIIHKLRPSEDWERNLLGYCQQHPWVAVIDRVDGIRTLQNRSTMLTPLHGEGVVIKGAGIKGARIQAPQQVELPEGTSLEEAKQLLQDAGLHPPLLVKPLWTDGREGSHGLAVLHDLGALEEILLGQVPSELQPPLVVQQFVEHSGVLFKVYVLGDKTVVSRRPSLGDQYLGKEKKGLLQLPRISCKSHNNLQALAQQAACEQPGNGTSPQPPSPPHSTMHALAGELRQRLGLQLFNFDLICPEEQQLPGECLYYVIDINYFPGVDKIADFEHVFVDFIKTTTLQHMGRAQKEKGRSKESVVPGMLAAGQTARVSSTPALSAAGAQASVHADPLLA